MNPQKEIPVLDDDGFYLSESIAIMQYLCDKYAPDSPLYPKDPMERALVNQRLCFNMGFFYSSVSQYVMAPIFFDYPRSAVGLKKMHISLEVFEEYLAREDKKFVAGDNLTIADFPLINSVMCLEAINFPFDKFTRVKSWYENFKQEFPELWEIADGAMKEIAFFEKNPPDLSDMNHPIHPIKKVKK
jgi:glutathione S-transferase